MADYSNFNEAKHGGNVHQAARRWGVRPEDVIDFSANINPLGTPAAVLDAIAIQSEIRWYPDITQFLDTLSQKIRVGKESIIVGNGSTALVFAAVRAINPKCVLLLEPAFGEYYQAVQAVGCLIDAFALQESRSFVPDFDELFSFVRSCRPEVVILNNPHNPSAALYSHDDIARFAIRVSQLGCYIIIDEAFIDYCPDASFLPKIEKHSNVIVIRSLTKFYAIPGLRIGYAVCTASLASKLRQQIEAWPVSSIALRAAQVAISDLKYDQGVKKNNEIARAQFATELMKIPGVTVFPSSANFLLVRLPNSNSANLADQLEPYKILIRCCNTFKGLNDSYVRLAVRQPQENLRLVELVHSWINTGETKPSREIGKGLYC